jgi:D-alanyl-lipoteichoic acid acyltransferase DltB (MBOAT superfamily)
MFFPQLVAGPIERPQNLLHQFYEQHEFDYSRVTGGLKRMAWGFFKKLVVADRLALYVNDVYNAPRDHNGLQLSIATVFFAYQIYCDFSGYSDIAIGSARVLGFRLMENFTVPYHSHSVAEFWQRWHISLSTWFRDYVYIPLGGNRVARPWWFANLLVTFTISGLWHGANWTFVLWGVVNGVYLIVGVASKALRDRVFSELGLRSEGIVRTTLATVTVFGLTGAAWVIFRARSVGDAAYIFSNFFKGWNASALSTEQFLLRQLPIALFAIATLETVETLNGQRSLTRRVASWPVTLRWPVYAAFVVGVVLFGIHRQSQFIYFQF